MYSHDAKVYVAARSEEKINAAIKEIRTAFPSSKGSLHYLHLDLGDLSTIKKSADEFLSKEQKLDVLWNNAGVMTPPQGSKTVQGYELQLGTNCIGPFLFTKLLTPILVSTAKTSSPGSVRVVWVSSSGAEIFSPTNGIDLQNLDYKTDASAFKKYGISKAGNWYHATEFARLHKADGVVSVALNPGNLKTELARHTPGWQLALLNLILHPAINGAYTELFAGLHPDVTLEKSGAWIQPWGRFVDIRSDLEKGAKSKSEGGTGIGEDFWSWCEEQTKVFA